MYCVNCGAELPEPEFEQQSKYLPLESRISCPGCETPFLIINESSIDQEGYIEVIFH